MQSAYRRDRPAHSPGVLYGASITSVPIPAATRTRLIGNYAIPGLGSFSIYGAGSGLAISLKEGVSEALYASAPDTYFILSTNLILHVTGIHPEVSERIVTGPFDVPFSVGGEDKH